MTAEIPEESWDLALRRVDQISKDAAFLDKTSLWLAAHAYLRGLKDGHDLRQKMLATNKRNR